MAATVVVVLGGILGATGLAVLALARRRTTPVPASDPVPRRRFLAQMWVASVGAFAFVFGGASLGVLWPNDAAGWRNVGKVTDIKARIRADGRPLYITEHKVYLVEYPTSDPSNRYVRAGVAAAGLMALFQKCSHLGCRVPYCPRSGWFECPCHDARFNAAGEVMNGPAPAGMWRFPLEVRDGFVWIDTSRWVAQPPAGTDTVGRGPAGAFCVGHA